MPTWNKMTVEEKLEALKLDLNVALDTIEKQALQLKQIEALLERNLNE